MINKKNFKLLNYFFSLIIISYFILLVSRIIFERSSKEIYIFCLFYVFFVGLQLLIPKLINFFVRKKQKNLLSQKNLSQDNHQESFFYRIKTSIFMFFISWAKKTRIFFQEFFKDFFFNFLAKNIKIKTFFFFIIKKMNLILKKEKVFIKLFLIIPWLFFVSVIIFEALTKETMYFSLYVLSINFLIKFFIKNLILISLKYTIIPTNILFQVYLTKIYSNEQSRSFFLSHPVMKEMLLTNFNTLLNKNTISFLWKLFGGIYYPMMVQFKMENFKLVFDNTSKLLRVYNLIIFTVILLFIIVKTNIFFFYVIILFFSSLAAFFVFLDSLKAETSAEFIKNCILLKDFDNWFIKIRRILLKKHPFLSFKDLPWFSNNKTATKMVAESLEIKNIMDKAIIGENLSFAEFSEYLLTEKQTEDLRIAEDIIYDWYIARVAEGVINGETNEFDYEKYTLSLKNNS